MTTVIRVQRIDDSHVVVLREDMSLTGEVLSYLVLLPYGHWRSVSMGGPYPEEGYLLLAKESA